MLLKKIAALLLFMLAGLSLASAQDLIALHDGNVIRAQVTEISPTEIRYRRFDHLDGPVLVIPAANVLSIRFETGRVEIITPIPPAPPQGAPQGSGNRARLNSVGVNAGANTFGMFQAGVSGTVSPFNFTLLDFGIGYAFSSNLFRARANFAGLVPFNRGAWYGGAGVNLMGSFAAFNITTGVILFDALNIQANALIAGAVSLDVSAGYVYRFGRR
jgi:hypothetical protein